MSIPGYGDILKQDSVDRHADQNQEALKTQRKQRAKIILSHMALLMVAPCCHRDGSQTDGHIDFDHSAMVFAICLRLKVFAQRS